MDRLRFWATSTASASFVTDPNIDQKRDVRRDGAKRVFDFCGAFLMLLLLSPILVIIGGLIALSGGRPILYRHKRIGKGGQAFYCFKFRTMVKNGDEVLRDHLASNSAARHEWLTSRKLQKDPRVTKIGAVLRKCSLDELPQFINILRGEMSLVGPRPIVRDEIKHYGAKISLYERTRPGLTGLWQISGRSDVSYEMRVSLDCEYVLHRSLWGDLQILLKTIPAVLKTRGSY